MKIQVKRHLPIAWNNKRYSKSTVLYDLQPEQCAIVTKFFIR